MTTPPESATDQVPTRARHGQAAHSRRCLPTIQRRATQAMIIIASICGLVFTASQLLTQPNPTDIHCRTPGSAALTSDCAQPSPSPQQAPELPHFGRPDR